MSSTSGVGGGGIPADSMDIGALAFAVLMESARDINADLRGILEEVKSIVAAKRKLREIVGRVRRDVCNNRTAGTGMRKLRFASDGMASEFAYHRVYLPVADCACAGQPQFVETDLHKGKLERVDQLECVLEDLKSKLDSMDEMSELTSLRLQMIMDRRAKTFATLSNVMKKVSATQDVLTQNLK